MKNKRNTYKITANNYNKYNKTVLKGPSLYPRLLYD